MASEYIGVNFGDALGKMGKITHGTSTGSTDIELRVDLAKLSTAKANRKEVLKAVELIRQYLLNNGVANATRGAAGNASVMP